MMLQNGKKEQIQSGKAKGHIWQAHTYSHVGSELRAVF
jgi:hypothetical protein